MHTKSDIEAIVDFKLQDEKEIWNDEKHEMLWWAEKIIPRTGVIINKAPSDMCEHALLDKNVVGRNDNSKRHPDLIDYTIYFTDIDGHKKAAEVAKRLRNHDMECIVSGNFILVPINSWLKDVIELFIQANANSASISR